MFICKQGNKDIFYTHTKLTCIWIIRKSINDYFLRKVFKIHNEIKHYHTFEHGMSIKGMHKMSPVVSLYKI